MENDQSFLAGRSVGAATFTIVVVGRALQMSTILHLSHELISLEAHTVRVGIVVAAIGVGVVVGVLVAGRGAIVTAAVVVAL